MSRGFKITLAVIVASVLVATILPTVLPRRIRSSRLDCYLCDRCAIQREVIRRWWLGIPRRGSNTMTATPLSRELAACKKTQCEHQYVLTHFDFHGISAMGHGGAKSPAALYFFTKTEQGATDLIKFARITGRPPEVVWRVLLHHFANSPRRQNPDFEAWLYDDRESRDSDAVVAWLRNHYEAIQTSTNKSDVIK